MRKVRFKKWLPYIYIDMNGKEYENYAKAHKVNKANQEPNRTMEPVINKEGCGCYSEMIYEGFFHQWGTQGDEETTNTMAIIEDEKGFVHFALANHVQFIKE